MVLCEVLRGELYHGRIVTHIFSKCMRATATSLHAYTSTSHVLACCFQITTTKQQDWFIPAGDLKKIIFCHKGKKNQQPQPPWNLCSSVHLSLHWLSADFSESMHAASICKKVRNHGCSLQYNCNKSYNCTEFCFSHVSDC